MNVVNIVRVTDPLELDEIVAIEQASFTNPWTRDMYAWELTNAGVSHLYALRDVTGPALAFCSFWLVFDEIHINNLAVLPAVRRRGHATRLLGWVLEEGRRLGARRATLEVRESNAAARGLYERMGFTVAGTRRHYYTNPVEDALILWREDL